ncbi:protein NKG7-like [Candoia aspera]|uniref:protein NKG7-like n=1 Tax=Candoia aspera TaxID=51853 RepID=UPI002FD84086
MNALNIGAAVCSCISLLFLLLALGSDYWLDDSVGHFGLWKLCGGNQCSFFGLKGLTGKIFSVFVEKDHKDLFMSSWAISMGLYINRHPCGGTGVRMNEVEKSDYSAFHAIRAFMILGMIAGAVSLGGLGTMLSQSNLGNISMGLISSIASFTAGLCVMIAMAIFSGQTDSFLKPFNLSTIPYGWSFGLGWTSFPLYLITGGLAYKLHKDTAVST